MTRIHSAAPDTNPAPSQPHAPKHAAPLVGPTKWFAAGAVTSVAALALIFVLWNREPRALPPLLSTAIVETQNPPRPSAASAPLSPATAALLTPAVTTASTPKPLVAPAPPLAAPASQAPNPPAPTQPQPAVESPPAPAVYPQPKPAPQPTTPAVAGGTVNVNTATAAELELLPQIGPALASRIIDYRTAHGLFKSASDLDKVRGIGPKTLAKLKGLIRYE
jgi:competence ComEA-like helix-hairpin-helix protein